MSAMTATAAMALMLLLTASAASAQFTRPATDLSGTWGRLDRSDPDSELRGLPGEYLGLPINDEARARADAWRYGYKSMPERQCVMYTSHYLVVGPGALEVTTDVDPMSGDVIAWRMTGTGDRLPRTIWMDGRPHPSPWGRHTADGFSTGEWRGATLYVRTTHLTEGVLTLNGLPISSEATIDEFITRHGAGLMVMTMILNDPIYLEEPYVKTRVWALNTAGRVTSDSCEPAVEVVMPAGIVPHYLPGENPDLEERARRFQIPLEAVRGGSATTYPEYMRRLATLPRPGPTR